MKSLTVVLIFLLLPLGTWGRGEAEEESMAMDKIVYLAVDYHDNPEAQPLWAAEFKRISGVDIELKTVTSALAQDVMIAQFMAGEFPDVVKWGGENLNMLARQEFIIPLDKFIEKSPRMSKLKEMYPSAFATHSVGGSVYGIPSQVGAARCIWARIDILDKLGLSMPKTLDEFVSILMKIKNDYPTPDGTPMFPLISKTYHRGYIAVTGNYFDVSVLPIGKRPNDKKFREGWDSPQLRDFANYIKMLYDEKLIDSDHVLRQKASKTESKFFAGLGAYLVNWAHNYPRFITELKKNFPDAEITLVPPIKNPKGGVMGLSLMPGYRPFCITKACKNPQFVWDKFIKTLYFNQDGVMLYTRGIPNVSYRIEDSIFIDNFDKSGIHINTTPPMDPDIKFPYKLSPLMEKGQEMQKKHLNWLSQNESYAVFEEPQKMIPAYDNIRVDMEAKKNELFWKYILGEHDFEEMLDKFDVYKKEVDFQSILNEINEGL